MPQRLNLSVTLPDNMIAAIDKHGKQHTRSRAYLLRLICQAGLKKCSENEMYPPAPEEKDIQGDSTAVTFTDGKGLAKQLTAIARKRDWERARLIRNLVCDAVKSGWLKDML